MNETRKESVQDLPRQAHWLFPLVLNFVEPPRDKIGAYPTEHPVSPGDLVATIYQQLGVDPETTVPDQVGRPMMITHGGQPIRAILA